MKNRNKVSARIILAIAVLFLGCQIGLAQRSQGGQGGPPPIPDQEQIDKMVDKLSEELDLSDDQKKVIQQKYEDHFKILESKMKEGRPDRNVMDAIKSDFENEVKAVLTDEQKIKYEKLMKKEQKRQRR